MTKFINRRTNRIIDLYPWSLRVPFVLQHPDEGISKEEFQDRWSLLDYARPVSLASRYLCAYCGRDMGSRFADFLCGHLEHIVPRYAQRQLGFDRLWVDNDSNLVLACSACNTSLANPKNVREFLKDVRPPAFPLQFLESHICDPDILRQSGRFENFMVIRDNVFDLKAMYVADRRVQKLSEFQRLRRGESSGCRRVDRKWRIAGRSDFCCAYCGRNLASTINDWLVSSIEHVVPRLAITTDYGYRRDLVERDYNCLAVCHTCNIFAVDKRVTELLATLEPPENEYEFDEHFEAFLELKRDVVRGKLKRYREFFKRKVQGED